MKKRIVKEKVNEKSNTKIKSLLQSSWLVKLSALVVVVPIIIVAVLLLTSMGGKGKPILGERYDGDLTSEITKTHLKQVEETLQLEGVDDVSVNLKSATLRVLINVIDSTNASGISNIANTAYNKINDILPVETYFTNTEEVKMYDLEIHVYNVIPTEDTTTAQIYAVLSKNGSAEESGFEWITTPKNNDVVDSIIED